MKKRIFSLLLAFVMLVGQLPVTAFAYGFAEYPAYIVAGDSALCGTYYDPTDASNLMALENGVYVKTYPNVAAGTYQFKVVGYETADASGVWYGKTDGNNVTIAVSKTTDVTITFDPSTKAVSFSGDGVSVPVETLQIDCVIAAGSGSGTFLNGATWDPADLSNKMTETSSGSGVYQITYANVAAGTYEFKFAANEGWWDSWASAPEYAETSVTSDQEYAAVYGSPHNIYLTVEEDDSTVTLTLDLSQYDHTTKSGATFTVLVTAPHNHTWEDEWESNETHHWNPCISCAEKSNYAEHIYGENGVCKCGETHPHTWADEWASNETHHWKPCTGCGVKDSYAEHSYNYSSCECGKAHPHTWEDEWESNETHHWNPCIGCVEKSNYAEHTYGENGTCICGAKDPNASAGTTVYFRNDNNWTTVNAYAWTDGGEIKNADWPGVPMTLVEGTSNIYSYIVPAGLDYVIFNGGGSQTTDLTVPTGDKNTYLNRTGGWVTLEEAKSGKVTINAIYAVGNGFDNWLNGQGWELAVASNKMTEHSQGIYQITYTNLPKHNDYQVKFVANDNWNLNWGGTFTGFGVESPALHVDDNIKFATIDESSDVTLTLDLSQYDDSTGTGATFTVQVTGEAANHQHAWSNEWSSDGDAHWHECTAEDCPVSDIKGKDGYAAHSYGEDDKCACGKANPDAVLEITKITAVGNGEANGSFLNGVNWDPNAEGNILTETSPGVYQITYTGLPAGDNYQVKFAANGAWAINWGGTFTAFGQETPADYRSDDNIVFETEKESTDVILTLDLTAYDHATKSGATFTIAEVKAPAHTHCICGKHGCTDSSHGGEITYLPWSEVMADTAYVRANGNIVQSCNVYLDSNVTLTDGLTTVNGSTLNLCLNGYTLNTADNQIKAGDGGTEKMNLSDCGTGGTITGGKEWMAIEVGSGTFTMYSGAISGNDNRAIYVDSSKAKASILGGTISGNKTSKLGGGGAIYLQEGHLVIGGDAVISGNTSSSNGGAISVYAYSATASLEIGGNAQIINNTATSYGGAIHANTPGGTIESISISGNAVISGNKAKYAGAIRIDANINATTISGNAKITGNTSTKDKDGTVCYGAVFSYYPITIADNVTIKDNYLEGGTTQHNVSVYGNLIDLTGLGTGANISINRMSSTAPTEGNDVQISTANAAAGAENQVHSDDPSYFIVRKDNVIYMTATEPHKHTWKTDSWQKDDTHHWNYECTDTENCTGVAEGEKGNVEAHTYGENGVCVCGAEKPKLGTISYNPATFTLAVPKNDTVSGVITVTGSGSMTGPQIHEAISGWTMTLGNGEPVTLNFDQSKDDSTVSPYDGITIQRIYTEFGGYMMIVTLSPDAAKTFPLGDTAVTLTPTAPEYNVTGYSFTVHHGHDHDGVTYDTAWDSTTQVTTLSESANIVLLDNVTFSDWLNINEGTTVNLCLNGHTLAMGSKYINNKGTLNICDCQTGGTITSDEYPMQVYGTANVTISSGTIAGGTGGIWFAGGNLAVTGGKISGEKEAGITASSSGSIKVSGGEITGTLYGIATTTSFSGTVTVEGGKVTSNRIGIDIGAGTVTVTGGEVTGTYCGIANGSANGHDSTLIVAGSATIGGSEGINNCKTLYLYGNPVFQNQHENIYVYAGQIYATANADGTGGSYTGATLKVGLFSGDNQAGDVLIHNAKLADGKFTLQDDNFVLKQGTDANANHLVLALPSYTVTFDMNGKTVQEGTAPAAQSVEKDSVASEPTAKPMADGLAFTGWYTDQNCTTAYDFSTPVTANITLYAGWVEDTIQKIEVTTPPTKTEYTYGESFDPAGMVVTATYLSGKTADVTEHVTVEAGKLTVPTTDVTISYQGQTAKLTVSVSPKVVTDPTFNLPDTLIYYYTGQEICPAVQVFDGETRIPSNEYTVTYENNIQVGSGKVIITDNSGGNYDVSGNTTFAILKAALTDVSVEQTGTLTYTGEAQTPTVNASATTVDGAAVTFTYSTTQNGTYSTELPAFTNAGTYIVYFKANAANHTEASGSFEVVVGKATPTADLFTFTAPANLNVCDGQPKAATVTPKDSIEGIGTVTIQYFQGETELDGAPIAEGTYTVKIDVAEGANYKSASNLTDDSWTFTFAVAEAEHKNVTLVSNSDGTHDKICSTCQTLLADDAVCVYECLANPDRLVSEATCVSGAIYYKSCACGHKSIDIWVDSTLDPENHTGTNDKLVSDKAGKHDVVWSCCGAVVTAKVACTPVDPDQDCTTDETCACGYVIAGNEKHTAKADDGDCTTAVSCANCPQIVTPAESNHVFTDKHDASCNNTGCRHTRTMYMVTYSANGHGTAPASETLAAGGKLTKPADPTDTDYNFGGWFREAACTNAWDFDTDTVSGNMTLFAKWTRKHVHTWSEDWSSNATHHWHPCTGNDCYLTDADIAQMDGYEAHSYEAKHDTEAHWQECTDCGHKKDVADHSFDSDCDTTCNGCTYTRTITHVYTVQQYNETHHWLECACGDEKADSREAHSFDNACDTTCNGCSFTRTITHSYTDMKHDETHHWNVCSVCQTADEASKEPHTGGIANCTQLAVCDDCGTGYGQLDKDNHRLTTVTYTDNRDGETHTWKRDCCGEEHKESHSYGRDNVCDQCEFAKVYTVLFDANGGEVSPTFGKTGRDWTLRKLPTPEREDYVFEGWYTSKHWGRKVTTSTVFHEDTVIYARWSYHPADSDSPKTGDITNSGLWLAMAVVGLLGLMASIAAKKRYGKRK